MGDTSNKTRCHRRDIREGEVCNIGQGKGQKELLLELEPGVKAMKQNHLDLRVTRLA